MKNKSGLVIAILALLVLVFGIMVSYAFIAKPLISGYVTKTYNQGATDTLNVILGQVQQQGYVEIPVGNGKSLFLAPVQQSQQNSQSSSESS